MKLMLYKANCGNWIDKIINLGTGNYGYSHVELAFDKIDKNHNRGYLCYSSSPREGKVRFTYIDNDKTNHWVVIDLPQFSLEDERRIYSKCFDYLNAKYDVFGIIFWYVFSFVKKQRDNEWWCSEIVAYLLGLKDYRKNPNELAKLYGAKKVVDKCDNS